MRLPWGIEGRHVLAAILGGALLVMPLLILSFDPESRLERLRTPLCRDAIHVEATNPNGDASLLRPDSGVKVRTTLAGEPVASRLTLFVREPAGEWRIHWQLDAPTGNEIFYLPQVAPAMEAYVRALDPAGAACPGDSAILRAPSG